jgi:hypothetical protein
MRVYNVFLGSAVASGLIAFGFGLSLGSVIAVGVGAGLVVCTAGFIHFRNPSVLGAFLVLAIGFALLLSPFLALKMAIIGGIGAGFLSTLVAKLVYS